MIGLYNNKARNYSPITATICCKSTREVHEELCDDAITS